MKRSRYRFMSPTRRMRCRKFESQLEHTRLLLAEMRAEHASLRQQHAELLNHSMQDAADAKAARLRARDTVCDLRAQVASAQADVRHGRAAAGEAAADGAVRLQHDVDHLQRCALGVHACVTLAFSPRTVCMHTCTVKRSNP